MAHRLKVNLTRVLLIACACAIWELASLGTPLIASPAASVSALVHGFASGAAASSLASTMLAVVWGFGLALVIGLPVGYLLGRSGFLHAVYEPAVASAFAIPRIIIYPVLLAFIGVGVTSKAWLAAISAVFPIILSTASALRHIDPILHRLGRSLCFGQLKMARSILLPAVLAPVMSGIRIAFGVAFVTVVIAELFIAQNGLGLDVRTNYAHLRINAMFGDVLLILVIALAGSLLLWIAERRLQGRSQ